MDEEKPIQVDAKIEETRASPLASLYNYPPEMEKTITVEQITQFFRETYEEAKNARKPKESKWDDAWNIYNNYYDFSDKAKWQSQNFLPKFKMAVRGASALLKKSLIEARQFFTFEGLNKESEELAKDIETTIYRILKQSKFVTVFNEALTGGLLENTMNFKIFPLPLTDQDRPIHPEQIYKYMIVPVSSYNLFLDPTGRDKYKIHRVVLDLADYRKLVKQGVYEKESLKYVEEDYRNKDLEYKEYIRKGQTNVVRPRWRKEVELMEYWGDVDDEYGNRIYENVTFTVVNERYLARFPIKNTYPRQPFIIAPIIKTPFSVYHEGFGDGVIPIAKMMTEILNQEIDANLYASIKAFVLNLDYVHNPTDIKSGVYPGKTIKAKGVPPGAKVIDELTLGAQTPNGMAMLASLDREFENGTLMTAHVQGLAGAGVKTATEYKGRMAQNTGLIADIAGDIEERGLEPALEMLYDMILQWNPEIFGDKIHAVPKEKLRFNVVALGLSKVLEKQEDANKFMMLLNIIGKTPLVERLNWDEIEKLLANSMNWDPEKVWLRQATQPPEVGQGPTTPEMTGEEANQAGQNQILQMIGRK